MIKNTSYPTQHNHRKQMSTAPRVHVWYCNVLSVA